jgi:hypothetical protein
MNEETDVLRPLPSRPPPIDGESLPSLFDRIAARSPLSVPLTTILYRVGVTPSELTTDLKTAYGVVLPEARLQDVAVVLRLPPERVRAMLLSHYDGVALDLNGLDPENPQSLRRTGMREWAYLVGSHYCPACLAEDQAWRIAWKLPFTFACERHQALLKDTCPLCSRRAGNIREDLGGAPRYAAQRRQPGHCMNPPASGVADVGRNARACGQDLGQVPQVDLSGCPRLMETQRHLNAVLETGQDEGTGLPTLEYLRTLRSLCALLLYVAQPDDLGDLPSPVRHAFSEYAEERERRLEQRRNRREAEGGRKGPSIHVYGAVPTQAALMAALLPKAVEMLTPDQDGPLQRATLSARVAVFAERLRERDQTKLRPVAKDFNFKGVLLQAWNAGLAARAGFDHRLGLLSPYGRLDSPYAFGPHHVPQLLWANEYVAHFAPLFSASDMQEDTTRRVCSAALVRLSGQTDWAGACMALDLPTTFSTGAVNKAMGVLNALNHSEAFAVALHDLALRLEALRDKANYHARRFALRDLNEVSLDEWKDLEWQSMVLPGRHEGRRRNIAAYLWAQVTGGDWRLAPALRGMKAGPARDMYVRFQGRDLVALRPLLDARAAQMAANIDIVCPELRLDFPENRE